jgi:hypothetical protein
VSTNLSFVTTQAATFTVSLLQPATHAISVQWLTNGATVNGATNAQFTLAPASLGNGSHTVRVAVQDLTPLVRTDPTNLLSQTVTWTLDVSITELWLDSPAWLGGGRFAFRVAGNVPQGFSIQASTNLSNWVSLTTNSLVGGQFYYTNSAAAGFPRRYFRAVTPP